MYIPHWVCDCVSDMVLVCHSRRGCLLLHVCLCDVRSIYSADALLSSLSVKTEKRDRREKSDHDRKKSYFEKPAEVYVAHFTSMLQVLVRQVLLRIVDSGSVFCYW